MWVGCGNERTLIAQVSHIFFMRPMSPTDAKNSSSVVACRLAATAPCKLHIICPLKLGSHDYYIPAKMARHRNFH